MWEYEIQHIDTGEISFIWGYNFDDACYRSDLDPSEVICLYSEYVD